MPESQQRLVVAVIDFLRQSVADGTVRDDDKEGLEVAIQCIGEAFGIDPSDQHQIDSLSVKPTTLQSIFDVFLQMRTKPAPSSSPSPPPSPASPAQKAQAQSHKQRGNSLMSARKFDDAIDAYTAAADLDPTNPVYYANRAAACSSKGDHLAAVGDAEKAIALDPKYLKSYSRLGLAYWSLGDSPKAIEAYQRGLALDPHNESLTQALRSAQQRSASTETPSPPPSNPPSAPPSTLPDMASLLANPQMRSMAQQFAAGGGLATLMQNPSVQNMMTRIQDGNMPSMEELMSNPALRDLASQFAAGAGAASARP